MIVNLYEYLKNDVELKNALGVDKNNSLRLYPYYTEEFNKFDNYAFFEIDSNEFFNDLKNKSDAIKTSLTINIVAKDLSKAKQLSELFKIKIEGDFYINNLYFEYDNEIKKYIIIITADRFN